MHWTERYLRNTVSGVGHSTLAEALHYYSETIKDVKQDITSLDDLCDVLNQLDIYGCESSFKIEVWEFRCGGE